MNAQTRRIVEEALSLPTRERVELVDELLSSLDRPDEHLDAEWRREAEDRLKAYREGQMKAVPLSDVLAKYRK